MKEQRVTLYDAKCEYHVKDARRIINHVRTDVISLCTKKDIPRKRRRGLPKCPECNDNGYTN